MFLQRFIRAANKSLLLPAIADSHDQEILMKQIKKLALSRKSFDEESEEVTSDEMRLRLVLYEEEMSVLRTRTDHLEKENESLQTELNQLTCLEKERVLFYSKEK